MQFMQSHLAKTLQEIMQNEIQMPFILQKLGHFSLET